MGLEQHLTLARYFHNLFGADSLDELKSDLSTCPEVLDDEGTTFFCSKLLPRLSNDNQTLTDTELLRYDRRITNFMEHLRKARQDFQHFRYFQYLALLYTEIYLDRLTSMPEGFTDDLNAFAKHLGDGYADAAFTPGDLRRLAFFMATGSGKTLIFHANVWQFWYYLKHGRYPESLVKRRDGRREFNQILLVTPNEGLSRQHLSELQQSGIDACPVIEDREENNGRFWPKVKIIEIHKLTEANSGEGVSIPVEQLGTANLVFVDEGHKGAGSEAQTWKRRQQALSKDGVLCEYSATFAQAINAAGRTTRRRLLNEYGRCILFDYSYRHFFGDGYGKDFHVLNASNAREERAKEMLLGGLLIFYQQSRLYARNEQQYRRYNLERPLWIMLGTSVSRDRGGQADRTQSAQRERADVARVVDFLKTFLEDPAWAKKAISDILRGHSGFNFENSEEDLFTPRLEPLRTEFKASQAAKLYDAVRHDIFHGKGGLELWEIKRSAGEIGLRTSSPTAAESPYFGVINIGDVRSFRKHIEDHVNIPIKSDNQRDSLFHAIDESRSRVNFLIGAKRFIEGWSSWRVSAMGLMNVAKGEGSQIMQLFGRGIRLKGKNLSLKRSSFIERKDKLPEGIEYLEKLYICGWNADYMGTFQKVMQDEEITQFYDLPLFKPENISTAGMYVPKPAKGKDTVYEKTFVLGEPANTPPVDLTPKLLSRKGILDEGQAESQHNSSGIYISFEDSKIKNQLDLGKLYAYVLDCSAGEQFGNAYLTHQKFLELLNQCAAFIPEEEIGNTHILQEAATLALDNVFRRTYKQWQSSELSQDMEPAEIETREIIPTYQVEVSPGSELLEKIQEMAQNLEQQKENEEPIPRLWVQEHLYNPLYREHSGLRPPGLNDTETRFIKDIREYWRKHQRDEVFQDWELYMVRNPSMQGIALPGDYDQYYFDFILWLKHLETGEIKVLFIEPHGMHNESKRKASDRASCIRKLQEFNKKPGFRNKNIKLSGWILTPSYLSEITWLGDESWDNLKRDYCLLNMRDNYVPAILGND